MISQIQLEIFAWKILRNEKDHKPREERAYAKHMKLQRAYAFLESICNCDSLITCIDMFYAHGDENIPMRILIDIHLLQHVTKVTKKFPNISSFSYFAYAKSILGRPVKISRE